ncbi:MAG: hypothetical protein EZS28_006883 [Streblomastix strix]|uniref:Uncharacterized protein n=1 Tax=Streblomastix strix TaxID=222440 RepID=A0A5J4WRQ0_9EUKA|nr:MAG: hypothetical protein EZS28_006883 [Streblomastix strix]
MNVNEIQEQKMEITKKKELDEIEGSDDVRRFVCLFEGSRSGVFKEDEEEDYEDYEFDNEDDSEGELELEIE